MIGLVAGHLLGMLFAILFVNKPGATIKTGADVGMLFFAVLFACGVFEFMVYQSLKHGRIYMRRWVYERESPGTVSSARFFYSFLSALFFTHIILVLLKR